MLGKRSRFTQRHVRLHGWVFWGPLWERHGISNVDPNRDPNTAADGSTFDRPVHHSV
jgi:hypothetical protein